MSRVCVVGAGFGGLALAIRLQSAGIETVLVEARDRPGGVACGWQSDGFAFDAGPASITDPAALQELWRLSGHDMAEDVELLPVTLIYRLNWPDGTTFDYCSDPAALRREIARIAPEDLAGYDDFLSYCNAAHQDAYAGLADRPLLRLRDMLRAAGMLARHQPWRSVHAMVCAHVRHPRLREALSFSTLLFGGNPLTTSAVYAAIHKLGIEGDTWWIKGGIGRLAQAMARHFERLGGTLRLSDPVTALHTLGDRVTEVEAASGWRERFDAVASNADIIRTYRQLLKDAPHGRQMARKLAARRFGPSLFVVNFGLEGSWPGIPHNMVLFAPRYAEWLTDVYQHGVLPRDLMIFLHHPTVTDPSVAPPGKSLFQAVVPVAHLGKLPIDWNEAGPILERRVLDEIGRRLVPDIHDRIITCCHYAPDDYEADFGAYHGSAFGLEPVLSQLGYCRPHNRDPKLRNFFLVGAGTHPGAGIPGVVASAKITAGLIQEWLA
ncbi:MAG: phytoene desaturase family protein [Novosphingobium sp.]|nr:phytoene desaturase family protein [Novosphingobium sp.]